MRARALLADDEQKVRSALRLLLENEAGVRVVGEVADADCLLRETRNSQPDLVLLDWELPGLASATDENAGVRQRDAAPEGCRTPAETLVRTLISTCPDLRVIALSWRPEARVEALAAGAQAFVSKLASPETLLDVLDDLLNVADDVAQSDSDTPVPGPGGLQSQPVSRIVKR